MSKKVSKRAEKESGGSLGEIWKEIVHKERGLMMIMLTMAVMAAILLIFSMTTLKPQNTVVIVGYGDVYGEIAGISGGYRRESWANMLAYPILAILFGLVHNLLILRTYKKYGKELAILLGVATMTLIITTFIVLIRLTGEW